MALFEPGPPTEHIPISGSDQIADVTGAGDTVIATMTLALAAGATFSEAAHLANYAGGLVVMKRGTATVQPTSCARPCAPWSEIVGPEDTGPAESADRRNGNIVTREELVDLVRADRARA